ncbi:MAG: hypothetical protein KF809_08955 [Chloroflexi bacterium]|nr:hypothetical protein [Chloroflexota bacterium]
MTPGIGRPAALTTAGWAVIGLLVGHVAAYDLVYPDAHVHATALETSGHGWLVALGPSLALAFLAVVLAAVVGARSGRPRVARFRTLVAIQVGAFLAMEVGERLAAGLTPVAIGHELIEHGLWLVLGTGILVQVVTAWLGSAASRQMAAATSRSRLDPRQRRRRTPLLAIPSAVVAARRPWSLRRSRAPPVRVISIAA